MWIYEDVSFTCMCLFCLLTVSMNPCVNLTKNTTLTMVAMFQKMERLFCIQANWQVEPIKKYNPGHNPTKSTEFHCILSQKPQIENRLSGIN